MPIASFEKIRWEFLLPIPNSRFNDCWRSNFFIFFGKRSPIFQGTETATGGVLRKRCS